MVVNARGSGGKPPDGSAESSRPGDPGLVVWGFA